VEQRREIPEEQTGRRHDQEDARVPALAAACMRV
jgi:hypothetical protein